MQFKGLAIISTYIYTRIIALPSTKVSGLSHDRQSLPMPPLTPEEGGSVLQQVLHEF
jgi:hypothetical protein